MALDYKIINNNLYMLIASIQHYKAIIQKTRREFTIFINGLDIVYLQKA
jgi:hypothetical protein